MDRIQTEVEWILNFRSLSKKPRVHGSRYRICQKKSDTYENCTENSEISEFDILVNIIEDKTNRLANLRARMPCGYIRCAIFS